jgi:protein ImuB
MPFACIYVPNFILQAIARAEPGLRGGPMVILEGTAPLLTVVALNEKACAAGAAWGMPQAEAALIAGIKLRRRSPAQEAAAHAALMDAGLSVSPRIEETGADAVVLDLEGLTALLGSQKEIAQQLFRRVAELGLMAQVAVAPNVEAALLAARGFPGIKVIAAGEEAERLGVLPVSALAPSAEILETLERWDLRTCQALAALPTAALSERMGQEGVGLQELARGAHTRPLISAQSTPHFEEMLELENGVEDLEPLAFILGRLLDQLCGRLSARSLATNELRLMLELEPCAEESFRRRDEIAARKTQIYESTLRLPVPMRDAKMLLKLWRMRLEANPPKAPIIKVSMRAEPARARTAQSNLFLPLVPDPEKLEVTLARVAHVVGQGNVGSPEPLDTHRPDAFRLARFSPASEEKQDSRGGVAASPRAVLALTEENARRAPAMSLRVFRPPVRAMVQMTGAAPGRMAFGGQRGEIVMASGPWRNSGDWWAEDGWEQDEWDVEVEFNAPAATAITQHSAQQNAGAQHMAGQNKTHRARRGTFRMYRELATGHWFVRGAYD